MNKITIIMTTYNGEKYVGEQIESILASPYSNFEISIYDDGSNDNTMGILRRYEELYPDIIQVHQNEQNMGVTLNFLNAICNTNSDYYMLCDQDDVWKPNKIPVTLKKMRQMEEQYGKNTPLAVFTDAVVVDKELNILHNSFFASSHMNPRRTDLPHLLMENKLIGCTVMFNASLRKILKSNHLPKEARFHDAWIGLIAASFGRIAYLNEATMLYRQHGNNVVGNVNFLAYIKDRITTINKQKINLLATQRQAAEFARIYGKKMDLDKRIIIGRFANLHKAGFVRKRCLILRHRYLKSGLVRNLGLMIII
ncbi:MAG: glycosyltransferase family 2 protein [Clostridiales bacterium]|jgi:glycosyltransferase involved in cell wall biosynthesis|nr:glycosyltransferase family 2 protein [Clostridiales bacterium]